MTTGAPLAPTGRRVVAFTVDLLVTALVVAGVYLATGELLYAALALVEVPVLLCVWEARSGLTVGNALLGVRTVRADGPYAPGIGRSAVRGLVVLAGFLVAAVGQFVVVASGAWDRGPLKQGWHDALGRTTMIDVSRRRRAGREVSVAETTRYGAPAVPIGAFQDPVLRTPEPVTGRAEMQAAVTPVITAPPAPAPPLAPAPAPAPVGRHGAPTPGPAPTPPVAPALPTWSPPRPAGAPLPAYLLSFDNGQSFTVHGSGLVGRKPQSAPGEHHDDLVAIDDDNRSLSKTHLEFGVDADGFWVTDRGSTNGTSVLTAHGDPLDVLVGARVRVPADGSVRVGQRQFTARPLAS